ncbi:hypothetical protein [Paraburkholderia lacunae]|uniref:hypothetical protein n=1 Tax=Paraburkholderia lacunae TaxID=2211104 RepID=UPI001058FC45|nr:hypothetical protein [Paraburkholderia lacunae]
MQAANFRHSVKRVLTTVKTSHASQDGLKIADADGSEGFFLVEIEAQRKPERHACKQEVAQSLKQMLPSAPDNS